MIISSVIYFNIQAEFKTNIKNLEKEFISTNKILVDKEVDRLYDYIKYQEELTKKHLNYYLKDKVDHAYKKIDHIYNKYKHLPEDKILDRIKETLENTRYNDGGYYFIISLDGDMIMHPIKKEIEGKNLINYQDVNGNYTIKEMVDLLTLQNETFHQWYWTKPKNETNIEYKKTGYLKKFKPLNLFIGIGVYNNLFEEQLKKEILDYIPKIKFGKNGYIFVLSYEGRMISYPIKKLKNKDILNAKDKNGKEFVKEMISLAKNNGNGFIEYTTPDTAVNKNNIKISYVKGFDKWQWVVGSGFFIQDLQDKIKQKHIELEEKNNHYKKLIFVTILIATLFLLLISILISKNIERQFFSYKNKIIDETNKNLEKDRLLAQQSKMASLGEMLGNIAHQWRQPLSGISTSSTGLALKDELGMLEKNDIKESTDTILDLTNYLSKTLDNFRNFFKPDKEKINFSLTKAIDNSLYIANFELEKNSIKIIKNLEEIELYAYENDIMQIILNLINNAKDALILHKDITEKLIFINVEKNQNKAILEIKDTAGGIDEKIIDKIFEPYFTTKHKYEGTGIGLYMVKEILIKHMDTDISVMNKTFEYNGKKHKGASFIIKFNLERQKCNILDK